jgi:hypothetical protein
MGVTSKKMRTYDVVVQSVNSDFRLDVNVTEIDRRELLTLESGQSQLQASNQKSFPPERRAHG